MQQPTFAQQQLSFDATPAETPRPAAARMEDDDFGIELTGRARTMFDAMKAIVVAPECRLKFYRQDFFKYDRARLAATHGTGQFIWIIRESGTHFLTIGVHARNYIEIDAVLSIGDACDIYLVEPARASLHRIDADKARELGKQLEYTVINGTVFKQTRAIAHMRVSFTPWSDGKQPQGIVNMTRTDAYLSKADLIALVQIAGNEVIERSQSLFTGMQTCTLDGSDMFGLIEQAQ